MDNIRYLSAQDVSKQWGISKRRVQSLCVEERIPGAVRIGNMWAIPADSVKPKDARLHDQKDTSSLNSDDIRAARKQLRSIVDTSINEALNSGLSEQEALYAIVIIFGAELLASCSGQYTEAMVKSKRHFDYDFKAFHSDTISRSIQQFISKNQSCLDDSLSWVYQFSSKKISPSEYSDTQFFTEKYMICTLVDEVWQNSKTYVADPACGGGNFLLYCFDKNADNNHNKNRANAAQDMLDHLIGYEIDPLLAKIAAFNLKYKAFKFAGAENNMSLETFENLRSRIYYPQERTFSGFLDKKWNDQTVINCDSGIKSKLSEEFKQVEIIVTNPPFRTIKGMPEEQKKFLQLDYPLSKADMCNAFIERILDVLPSNGRAALVTQNSWMYLDSFAALRSKILNDNTVFAIWELGSNAFIDLSGEKANIALAVFEKAKPDSNHSIKQYFLRNMSTEQIEHSLTHGTCEYIAAKQNSVLKTAHSRFDMISTSHLRDLETSCKRYSEFAVPMQGTSTGNSKELIDYYWNHTDDENWVLVSKGGGYSRYEGLNSYVVKWGNNGEFIKQTNGSALRNIQYFDKTQLVFSDTGTAGLSVRILLPGQLFVASGPGIRVLDGQPLAHLAFLNSRFASFYVRLLSPKLTIAAGYIGQIPVTQNLLKSKDLERLSEKCLRAKKRRLSKRPCNIEFEYFIHASGKNIRDIAYQWFLEDIQDQWDQLQCEQTIEDLISTEMKLRAEDQNAINNLIGERIIYSNDTWQEHFSLENYNIEELLDCNCNPKRTKASKKTMGADCLIEYLSQKESISCEKVFSVLQEEYSFFEQKYVDLYLHSLIMSGMRYKDGPLHAYAIDEVLDTVNVHSGEDREYATGWIINRFNIVHPGCFDQKLLLYFNADNGILSGIV